MKIPVSLFWRTQASRAFTVDASIRPAVGFLIAIAVASLSGLSSCQRASQAYFAPTHQPVIQRTLAGNQAATPTAEPILTASVGSEIPGEVPRLTEPAWAATDHLVVEPTLMPQTLPVSPRQQSKRKSPAKALPPQCDQIVLRNGDLIDAKIKEVGVSEIKYKKCDRQDGPDYTISKRDVLSIKYSNGEVERFNTASTNSPNQSGSSTSRSYNSPTNAQDDGPRTDPFAIVAIATGALAVLTGYGAFLLGAAAIVFGALSLSRIRKEPQRFKGKGLAIGGMVAGLVSAGLILLYILL